MDQVARLFAAAFFANEYLDFDVHGRIGRLNTFEPQLTIAEFTVRRWRRLNEVAHVPKPFARQASQRSRGTLRGVPINSDLEKGLALWCSVAIVTSVCACWLEVKPYLEDRLLESHATGV